MNKTKFKKDPRKKKPKSMREHIDDLRLRGALIETRDRVMKSAEGQDLPDRQRKYRSVLNSFKKRIEK